MKEPSLTQILRNSRPENWSMLFAAFAASYGIGLLALLGLPFMFGATIDGLGLSESQAGFLGTVEFLAIMVATLCVAPFMGVAPRKLLAFMGSAIAVIGNVLCVITGELPYETLILYRSIAGLGCGLALAVGNATVSNATDTEKMSAHMAVLFVALMAVTMLVFSWASASWGFRGVYGALAVCMLVVTPLLIGLPQSAAEKPVKLQSARNSVGLFSLPSLFVLFAMLIFAMRDMSGWAFVERIGLEVGYSASEIGWLLSLQALVGISGPLIATFIGTRFGLTLPLIIGILASGAVYFAMLFMPDSRQVYTISAMFIGGTYFFAFAYLTALAAEIDSKGRVVAASGGFLSAGIGLGPLVGGYLVENYGYEVTSWMIFAMVILTLIFALLGLKKLRASQNSLPDLGLDTSIPKQVSHL
jgi:predicted MFS family arabinose efflux permease